MRDRLINVDVPMGDLFCSLVCYSSLVVDCGLSGIYRSAHNARSADRRIELHIRYITDTYRDARIGAKLFKDYSQNICMVVVKQSRHQLHLAGNNGGNHHVSANTGRSEC